MQFLPEVGDGNQAFSLPNHQVFPLSFPRTGEETATKWETNVLIIPAYMGKGVRMSKNVEDWGEECEHTLRKFDSVNPYEIYCLKGGTKVKFHLEAEGKGENERDVLAAVSVVVVLCKAEHPRDD
jgi:hypothetical protein